MASLWAVIEKAYSVQYRVTLKGLASVRSSEEFLFELRLLRDFDPEWFDNAFAWTLCLGLA